MKYTQAHEYEDLNLIAKTMIDTNSDFSYISEKEKAYYNSPTPESYLEMMMELNQMH